MEKISSFKDFQSIYTERNQTRLSEENEIKRDAIAEKVKSILSEMEISSLIDLDEETKLKFIDTLFSEEVVIDAEEAEEETSEEEESEEEEMSDDDSDDDDDDDDSDDDDEESVEEAEINNDEEFQEYAMKVLKQAHGDDFDEEKAQKAIDGLKSKYSGDYGAMIGALS